MKTESCSGAFEEAIHANTPVRIFGIVHYMGKERSHDRVWNPKRTDALRVLCRS